MRALVLCHEFPPLAGGASGATAHLSRAFAARGHEVAVLTSALSGLPARERVDGVDVVRVPALRRRADRGGAAHFAAFALRAGLRARSLARDWRPDAALAFFGFPAGVAAWWLWRGAGVPYVVSLRGGDVPGQQPEQLATLHRLAGPLLRRVWAGAGAVAAVSEGLAGRAREFSSGLDVAVIPNAVDGEIFQPGERPNFDGGPLRLLFAGRLSPEKNVGLLLRALAALDADWTLDVAGDGEDGPALRALARELGIQERVRFAGFVPREAMPEVYRRAHVLVQPSRFEGMSNVVLEAMASGLAVVGADTPGLAELVRHEDTGLVVPAGDGPALGDALARLAAAPETVAAMGLRGREAVLAGHGWEAAATAYLELLERAAREA